MSLDDHLDLLKIVINKLHINVVFRLYKISNKIRKIVNDDRYWKRLIERDLGVVPKFKIDYHFYYLRAMGFPIRSKIITLPDAPPLTPLADRRSVIRILSPGASVYSTIVFPDGSYSLGDEEIYKLPNGEIPRDMFVDIGRHLSILLSESGRLYNLRGGYTNLEGTIPNGTLFNKICYPVGANIKRIALTKQGEVYANTQHLDIKLSIPEPIITIDPRGYLLGESGKLYYIPFKSGRPNLQHTFVDTEWYESIDNVTWIYDNNNIMKSDGKFSRLVGFLNDRAIETPIKSIPIIASIDNEYVLGGDLKTYQIEISDRPYIYSFDDIYKPVIEIYAHPRDPQSRLSCIRVIED
jgi:hypothetical protein